VYVIDHPYNSSTWEAEAGGSRVHSLLDFFSINKQTNVVERMFCFFFFDSIVEDVGPGVK
jgi:hypothetical protein